MSGRIAVISQPRFLPAANYVHRMIVCDVFVLLDTVQFSKRDWENRNRIKVASGPAWVTVPVRGHSRGTPIHEIRIDNEQPWADKILGMIRRAYEGARFFDENYPGIADILRRDWDRLVDLNVALIDWICSEMSIRCEFVKSRSLGVEGTGQELLIELCKAVGANHYLSGPNGRDYIDTDQWQQSGIGLHFHDYVCAEYPQQFGEFEPWLSVVDMLMNCGPNTRALVEKENINRAFLVPD